MLAELNLRRCSASSEFELGLHSVTSPRGKYSATTGSCSSDSLDPSPTEIPCQLSRSQEGQAG